MTNAELAILTLLAEKPRHGYEIEQVIQKRNMREWTEVGFSSIYYLLKKLEGQRLIEGCLTETECGPARRVYRPTRAGWAAARTAVVEALSVPRHSCQPLYLGLVNLPGLPADEAVAALQQRRHKLMAERQLLESKRDLQSPLPYFVDAMFDYSIAMLTAEVAWVEAVITRIGAGGPTEASREEQEKPRREDPTV